MNDPETSRFVDEPDKLLTLVQAVLKEIEDRRNIDNASEKESQLREISHSVKRLEANGIPVPEELRKIKMDLMTALSVRDSMTEKLVIIQDGIKRVLTNMQPHSGDNTKSRTGAGSKGTKRPRGLKTEQAVLREYVIKALKKLGGSAKVSAVIAEMEIMLRGKLRPRDLEHLKTGEVVWVNSAMWERFKMKEDGILRSDSKKGIWELNKDYK